LEQLVTSGRPQVDQGYKIFNVGPVNDGQVLSAEHFVPMAGNRFIAAIERLCAVAKSNRKHGVMQTAPLALRFVRASSHYLSMLHGEDRCAIETPLFAGGTGAVEVLLSYEQALYQLGSRPHWGQLHEFTGSPGWFQRAYPKADRWLGVFRHLNPKGSFDNHFTDRMGFREA
jgi:xylitol oxidase